MRYVYFLHYDFEVRLLLAGTHQVPQQVSASKLHQQTQAPQTSTQEGPGTEGNHRGNQEKHRC